MDWKKTHLTGAEIQPVQKLLDMAILDLSAAHGTNIPYEG